MDAAHLFWRPQEVNRMDITRSGQLFSGLAGEWALVLFISVGESRHQDHTSQRPFPSPHWNEKSLLFGLPDWKQLMSCGFVSVA